MNFNQEKRTQFLRKKVWYLISILGLVSEPVKTSELVKWLEYKNEKYFRDNYIKPLRQTGLSRLTNPENPTDPENMHIITEAEKAFLAGL